MWLLESSKLQEIENARREWKPTATEYYEFASSSVPNGLNILSMDGDIAKIEIKGIMVKARSFFSVIFGERCTTYGEIIDALAEADKNPRIASIHINMDSPGGDCDDLFTALDAIKNTQKSIVTYISNSGCSAAYAIASLTSRIIATNRGTMVGSIGVATSCRISDYEKDIASSKAPKKRPDARTEKGVAVIR